MYYYKLNYIMRMSNKLTVIKVVLSLVMSSVYQLCVYQL